MQKSNINVSFRTVNIKEAEAVLELEMQSTVKEINLINKFFYFL